MKKTYLAILFLTTLLCLQQPAAYGQFWKKIFKKEKKEKEETKPSPTEPEKKKPEKEASKKKVARKKPVYPPTVMKSRYRVDVLLPLSLNQLVRNGRLTQSPLPASVQPAVHFYQGLKMAADSMGGEGYPLDLYIHDITDPAHDIGRLVSDTGFLRSDLVIGFLQSSDLPPVAGMAKTHSLNFVSALSPSDANVHDNPYFILIQPTLRTHIEKLVAYSVKKFSRQPKLILCQENTGVQKEALDLLKENLSDYRYRVVHIGKQGIRTDSLRRVLDSTEVNVVYINVLSTNLAAPILAQLSALTPTYRIAVFGMPSWKALDNLRQPDAYQNLDIYYTNPFYYDTESRAGKKLQRQYQKTFGQTQRPSEMVFRGYETLYWMGSLLQHHGSIFNPALNQADAAPFTRYEVLPVWNEENEFLYLENRHLNIFHFRNGFFRVD